jgi:MFS family permease
MPIFKPRQNNFRLAGGERLQEVCDSESTQLIQSRVANDAHQVLPQLSVPWWRVKHLLLLNSLLMIPFFSQSVVGFDGKPHRGAQAAIDLTGAGSMMNGLQSLPRWRDFLNDPPSRILGTIKAVYPVGKIVGLVSSAVLGDHFGRRLPFVTGLLLLILGAGLQGGAINPVMFIVSRLILGAGTGFVTQTSQILVTELSYPPTVAEPPPCTFPPMYVSISEP